MFPWNLLFPFQDQMKKMMPNGNQFNNPQDLEKHFQEMMNKVVPPNLQNFVKSSPFTDGFNPFQQSSANEQHAAAPKEAAKGQIFESHDHIFVRIPVEDERWLENLKIFHTSNQLILENIPERGNKQLYTLPSIVKRKGVKANYKENILEVVLPKNIDIHYSEVSIQDHYHQE